MACVSSTVSKGMRHLGTLSLSQKYSTKAFDIKQIAKINRENSSLDGVKKTVGQKTRKARIGQNVDVKKTETIVDVPDCFSVILQSPLYSGVEINASAQNQFKDFVESLDIGYLPSVSSVLDKSQSDKSREVLARWKTSKTKELGGAEQFDNYMQDIVGNGMSFHKCIEQKLKGEPVPEIKAENEGHWKSIEAVLGDVKHVRSLEYDCVHPEVFYRGKFDCIAEFRNTLCLIEWKTSGAPKPILSATYDNPIQVAAYMGAVNRSGLLKQFDIPDLTRGALVFAYPTGEPATVHMMSQKVCEKYWKKWVDRVYLYWVLQYKKSLEQ